MDFMVGWAVTLATLTILVAALFCRWVMKAWEQDRERWFQERDRLLNRIMARDYTEFQVGEKIHQNSQLQQPVTDEMEAELYQQYYGG